MRAREEKLSCPRVTKYLEQKLGNYVFLFLHADYKKIADNICLYKYAINYNILYLNNVSYERKIGKTLMWSVCLHTCTVRVGRRNLH